MHGEVLKYLSGSALRYSMSKERRKGKVLDKEE